jgi:hypothetical protein
MEEPEGFKTGSDLVCKLQKGLNGLKQSPRAWHRTFNQKLTEMKYTASDSDSCLYIKKGSSSNPIYIVMYVDDGLIIGKHEKELKEELNALNETFKLTIQPLQRFLGIEISRGEKGIFLHQQKYIKDILERFNMSECKTRDTPMLPGLQLEVEKVEPDTSYDYQGLIGSLLFLARCTRPDIAYAVHYLARFFSCYQKSHWKAAKAVLQYLQGCKNLGLLYTPSECERNVVHGYVDADYGSDKQSRKSTSGSLFVYNCTPIIWLSKRQTCIALSSTESEYIALALGGKEAVWVNRIYSELGEEQLPICISTDSQSAIKLAKNPEYHDKTKHIDIRHHYIRRLVETGCVVLDHVSDPKQPADLLTKSVARETFLSKRHIMGMENPPVQGTKRRAMSSVVIDPKRAKTFFALMMKMMLALGATTEIHKKGNSVIWRKTDSPAVIGFQAVSMHITLISPCTLLPMKDMDPAITKVMKEECEKAYEDFFMSNLEKMCPYEKAQNTYE